MQNIYQRTAVRQYWIPVGDVTRQQTTLLRSSLNLIHLGIGRVSGSEWVGGFRLMLDWDTVVWCLHGCFMYIWIVWFERWMHRVLGKLLELLSVNGGRFEINQLSFAYDTALGAYNSFPFPHYRRRVIKCH